MNRRCFLKNTFGGIAAAAAVRSFPFRVFSFPSEIVTTKPVAVRFIRIFDPIKNRMINRWDTLIGFSAVPENYESSMIVGAEECWIGPSKESILHITKLHFQNRGIELTDAQD